LTESIKSQRTAHSKIRSAWDMERISSLLTANVEEIERECPLFFGTLKIEINYRGGEIDTVTVDRRQTFKD
jgi:hypothetical protein